MKKAPVVLLCLAFACAVSFASLRTNTKDIKKEVKKEKKQKEMKKECRHTCPFSLS